MTEGVSILVATYNGATYLDEQLRSILEQVTTDDEVIVIDDCSSDDSVAIVARYIDSHANLRLVENDRNVGVKATIEALLRAATREIIFLSDQDDIWVEGRKNRMVETLRHDGCVAVLANALVMTERGVERPFFPVSPDVRSIFGNFVQNNFIGCCMALRREVLTLALPFPPGISMHDWWLGTAAMALGDVRFLPEPSLLYRRHGSNQSAGRRRAWQVVAKDRGGNLLALAVLVRRLVHLRATQKAG